MIVIVKNISYMVLLYHYTKIFKKLIKHYTKNGIIPARFFNTNVVEIGDYVPFICEQVREFSLVQRNHILSKMFYEGFLYGDRCSR